MAKYLFMVSYTADGAKGVLKEGGSTRRAAGEQAAKAVGAKIESFYFAFGDTDAFVIADAPDHASSATVSLGVAASGGARIKTVVLMTPEEMDQAAKRSAAYRPPGKYRSRWHRTGVESPRRSWCVLRRPTARTADA